MTAFLHDPLIPLAARAALAALFLAAAAHKARDLADFRAILEAYRLLPAAWVGVAAAATAAAEVGVAAALATPAVGTLGAGGALVLLAVYSGAIAINLARGRREIDCGCGGAGARQPLTPWLLARNALLAVVALLVLVPAAPRPLVWLDGASLAGTLGALACCWVAAHRLLAAAARVRATAARHSAADAGSVAAATAASVYAAEMGR